MYLYKRAKRLLEVEQLLNTYEGDENGSRPSAPDSVAIDEDSQRIAEARNKIEIALGLIQEYGDLYRHYDDQRYKFLGILLIVASAVTAADRLTTLEKTFPGWTSGAVLIVLGVIGLTSNMQSRQRMRLFYERIRHLRRYLDTGFPELEIMNGVNASKEKVEKHDIFSWIVYRLMSRHMVWSTIPFLIIFAGIYLLVQAF